MKQVLQSLRTGELELADVPCPGLRAGHVLVATRRTLISAGTERMLREFGAAGLLGKIRQQPDKLRMVLDKVRADGLLPAIEAVRSRLDQPVPMGYSNAGVVLDVAHDVTGFAPGDRVVSNGPHAEIVCVPKNLCAKIPDGVSDEQAAFTVLGAIALQSVRLAEPTLGESFGVIGLGLVGLLTVQMLSAHGCRVLGADFNGDRLRLAGTFGAETFDLSTGADLLAAAERFSRGRGLDGVVIAAATDSSEPVRQAARMCRRRGRIVLVGVAGLELSRADFYEKELSFRVSCSYGPGRHDRQYEEQGHDYPPGFVRWTAGRNFEAVLDLLAAGRLDVAPLVSHRFPLQRVDEAYAVIDGKQPSLGIVLEYAGGSDRETERRGDRLVSLPLAPSRPSRRATRAAPAPIAVGFLGAGNFAARVLIPEFRRAGAELRVVACTGGLSGFHAARRHGIAEVTTDAARVLEDPDIDAVVIATRHDTHADLVCRALAAGKHVFVEKPLALTREQLDAVASAYLSRSQPAPLTTHPSLLHRSLLHVGFNRRFAPHVQKIAALLASVAEPKSFLLTVNAGAIAADHWTQDPLVGGGRIVGEACHFIDLLRFLCGHAISGVQATRIGPAAGPVRDDKLTFTLSFADGSFGNVHYLANGHRSFPKERLEVFCGGRILQLDNYRRLRGYGWPGFSRMHLWRQDRGHRAEVQAFLDALRTAGPPPLSFDEAAEATRVSFDILTAARTGQPISYVESPAVAPSSRHAA